MAKSSGEKLIAKNPDAYHNFFIDEVVEAGIVLTGTEVKSLRAQSPNLKEAYVLVESSKGTLEAYLIHAHISPYVAGNIWNHEPLRKRKLLLHKRQITSLFGAINQKGMTLVPTRMYFKNGKVKIEVGLGKGKKRHDKRDTLRKKDAEREMAVARKHGR